MPLAAIACSCNSSFYDSAKAFRAGTRLESIFAYLFAKLPQLRDSEVTFAVFNPSCHLLLLPV